MGFTTWFIIQRDQGGGGDGNFSTNVKKLCENHYGVMKGYQFTPLRIPTLALHSVHEPFASGTL